MDIVVVDTVLPYVSVVVSTVVPSCWTWLSVLSAYHDKNNSPFLNPKVNDLSRDAIVLFPPISEESTLIHVLIVISSFVSDNTSVPKFTKSLVPLKTIDLFSSLIGTTPVLYDMRFGVDKVPLYVVSLSLVSLTCESKSKSTTGTTYEDEWSLSVYEKFTLANCNSLDVVE